MWIVSMVPARRESTGTQATGRGSSGSLLDKPAAILGAAGTGVSRKVHSLLGQPKAGLCLDQPSLRDCELESRLELLHGESPFVLDPTPPVLGDLARHQPEEIRTCQHRLLEQCFAQHPRHAVSVGEVGFGHWGSRRNDPTKPLVACGRCDERPRPHLHRRLRPADPPQRHALLRDPANEARGMAADLRHHAAFSAAGRLPSVKRPRWRSNHSLKFLFPLARQWVVERRSLERAARGDCRLSLVPT